MTLVTADLSTIYDETLTIVNRLDAKDSDSRQDSYRKTVVTGCMWNSQATRRVNDDGTVTVGTLHRVQIPESPDYLPYREWAKSQTGFTIRQGDYIVRGTVDEELDAATAKRVLASYEPDVFQVQHFRDLTKKEGFVHSSEGVMRFAECYYVEG